MITAKQRIQWASETIDDLGAYWPLALRQIFYQLVARGKIPNKQYQYQELSSVLSEARIEGLVPWESMTDRTRPFYAGGGYADSQAYLETELDCLADAYRRDLQQGQGNYLEVVVEKDALSTPFARVCDPLGIPLMVSRGFSSTSALLEYAKRATGAKGRGFARPIILYFSDLDPSGMIMPETLSNTLIRLGLDVVVKRPALTVEQVRRYDLDHDPRALKESDSRAKAFVAQHGRYAVELDALPPANLEGLVRKATEGEIDMALVEEQYQREEAEKQRLREVAGRWLDEF